MKQKLLSIFALAAMLLLPQGVWADDVIFSMSSVTSLSGENVTSETVESVTTYTVASRKKATVDATFSGGTADVYNGHTSNGQVMLSTSDQKIDLSKSSYSYFCANISGTTIQEGDVISIVGSNSSYYIHNGDVRNTSVSFSKSYTVPNGSNLIGKNKVYIYKNSGSSFTGFTITRPVPPSVTISSANKYATYCSHVAVSFDEKATVYKAQASGSTVTLTEVAGGQVPANTGVILFKDVASDEEITPTVIASADAVEDNELVGVTAETEVNYNADTKYNYIFQNNATDGLGFYKATGKKIKANRAYLSTTVNVEQQLNSAPKLNIVFNNAGTTAIGDELKVNTEESENKVYYNLAGQRVTNPTKGLYIVNGRKVVIK